MLQLCCVLDRQFSVSFSWSQLHYKCFCYIKDTLKAFDDFKNKQKSAWNNVFWYVNVCIFWNCIHYNIHWDKTQMIKSLPSDKINGTKNAFFFFLEVHIITVSHLVCDSYINWKTKFVSLKLCVWFSIFNSFSFLLKFIFLIKTCFKNSLTFRIKTMEKPDAVLLPDLF